MTRHGPVPQPAIVLVERQFGAFPTDRRSCWLWTGPVNSRGYGRVSVQVRPGFRRWRFTHRVTYEHFIGPIPAGLVLDHKECDTSLCCNPWHLLPTSNRQNILRGNGLSARRARQTHCKRGHEFTPENTAVSLRGQRNCRTCKNERRRLGYVDPLTVELDS